MKKKKPVSPLYERLTNANTKLPYDGKELKRLPGLTDERMYAYTLPSRIGDQLFYPKERK
jgi:hypothetical protein